MKHKVLLTLSAATAIGLAIGSVPAIAAVGHGNDGRAGHHPTGEREAGYGTVQRDMGGRQGGMMQMMQMMRQMQGGMMDGGMMGGRMNKAFDTNSDGSVSPEELRAGLLLQLSTYDADGDGTLSLEEFAALTAEQIRTRMVDRFQALDENGDGQVTETEMTATADMMQANMMRRNAANSAPHMQDDDEVDDSEIESGGETDNN